MDEKFVDIKLDIHKSEEDIEMTGEIMSRSVDVTLRGTAVDMIISKVVSIFTGKKETVVSGSITENIEEGPTDDDEDEE